MTVSLVWVIDLISDPILEPPIDMTVSLVWVIDLISDPILEPPIDMTVSLVWMIDLISDRFLTLLLTVFFVWVIDFGKRNSSQDIFFLFSLYLFCSEGLYKET